VSEAFHCVEGVDLSQRFGRNLRSYRESLGLSQEAFAAEVMDVSRVYWNHIERGTRNLTLRTVASIAERVGIDPADLLAARLPPSAERTRNHAPQ